MYKIAKEQISALLQAIAEKMDLFVPVKNENQANFQLFNADAEVDLDTLKTLHNTLLIIL